MTPRPAPLGVYIHWPFCKSKCPYCDFNSHVRDGVEQGRWRRAVEVLDAGETMLRETCTGVAWELHSTQLYSMWCLYHLGHANEIEKRLEHLLEDVRRRRDLFLEAGLCTMFLTFVAVAHDDPALGRRQLDRIAELRLDEEFTVQHFWDLEARVLLALYEGDDEAALDAVATIWVKAVYWRPEAGA